jgi:hypothetical protein
MRRITGALFLCLTVFLPCQQTQAQDEQLRLYAQKIRAGLIYNFLKYTEWPASKLPDDSPSMTVCIFGRDDPFEGYLQPIDGRTVNQRTISLRHVTEITDTTTCHLIFVNTEEKDRWPQLRGFLGGKSVLTVSDLAGFTDTGGMIEFGNRNDRIYIELNTEAIRAAHLLVYDSLRKLAIIKGQ